MLRTGRAFEFVPDALEFAGSPQYIPVMDDLEMLFVNYAARTTADLGEYRDPGHYVTAIRATLYPFPEEMARAEGHQIQRAQRKLSLYWQSIGFRPIPGSSWLVSNAGIGITE